MISKKLWVYSGLRPSNGAKELANHAGFLRLRQARFFKLKPTATVINWGSTQFLPFDGKVLNKAENIQLATNKLAAFYAMEGQLSIPEFTESVDKALEWLGTGATVVVRNKLTGHSGDGIVILEKGSKEVPKAPLYTKYIFKTREFRVHVVGDKVIDTQQKVRDPDQEVKSWKVRSHANGFIFARNGIELLPKRDEIAILAIKTLGLDFGAVDIVEDKKGNFYVLEVNTAPGLEGQTITNYAEAFLVNQG